MDFQQGVVVLTEKKETLDHLRSLGNLHMDPKRGKEYYISQFNGQIIHFYPGEPKTLPVNVARALEESNVTVLTEKCPNCKGAGSTVAGICINCKGRKRITMDGQYRILKVTRTFDAMLVDPASLPAEVPLLATKPEESVVS